MAQKDSSLPSYSGTSDSLYGSLNRVEAERPGRFKRESVSMKVPGQGFFFGGGVSSAEGMRQTLVVALTLSIAAGGVAGSILGSKTGVKPGLEAAARADAVTLARLSPANAPAASPTAPPPEVMGLVEEMRGLRAQVEQLKHVAERARAREAEHQASLEGPPALDQATAALTAKLGELDNRLARLEHAGVDMTPTGSIASSIHARPAAAAHARKARRSRSGGL